MHVFEVVCKELNGVLGPVLQQEGDCVFQVRAHLLLLQVVFGRLVVLVIVLLVHRLVLRDTVKS